MFELLPDFLVPSTKQWLVSSLTPQPQIWSTKVTNKRASKESECRDPITKHSVYHSWNLWVRKLIISIIQHYNYRKQ